MSLGSKIKKERHTKTGKKKKKKKRGKKVKTVYIIVLCKLIEKHSKTPI